MLNRNIRLKFSLLCMRRNYLKVSNTIFSFILFVLSAWICWFIITKIGFSIECKCVVHNDVSLFTTLLFPSLYIDIYHTWERKIIYCTLSENISRLHFITFNMHLASCIFSAVYIGWAILDFMIFEKEIWFSNRNIIRVFILTNLGCY